MRSLPFWVTLRSILWPKPTSEGLWPGLAAELVQPTLVLNAHRGFHQCRWLLCLSHPSFPLLWHFQLQLVPVSHCSLLQRLTAVGKLPFFNFFPHDRKAAVPGKNWSLLFGREQLIFHVSSSSSPLCFLTAQQSPCWCAGFG